MGRLTPREYDWFGYVVWFGYGMVIGGLPVFVLHIAVESVKMSNKQLIGWLVVCCLGGGFWWGRKHRREWERRIGK